MPSAVSLTDAGKRYVKYDDVPLLITRAWRFSTGQRRSHLWALRHVDMEIQPGESVGVIGRNGAGKSTMLRLLAGVTGPTEGIVRVRGRVAPLISVGVGFHRELTGRENVYVNGVILGLTTQEIDGLFDSIVAFSEIEDFIDTPVKFYSSGMFVRLGFAVAVASDPEVLLVDEVLAVGDFAFQKKCFDRMEQIRSGGATIVVVSHNMAAVRSLCSRTMVLDGGVPVFEGATDEAISIFHEMLAKRGISAEELPAVKITDFTLQDEQGNPTAHFEVGDEMTFCVEAQFAEPSENPAVLLRIYTEDGQLVYGEVPVLSEPTPVDAGGMVRWIVRLPALLPTRSYSAEALVGTRLAVDAPMSGSRPILFYVSGRPFVLGAADLRATFEARAYPSTDIDQGAKPSGETSPRPVETLAPGVADGSENFGEAPSTLVPPDEQFDHS
ncbi:MAG: ABC transporter ATP-binding protein [Actinobacteria bacterium]|nr:MAG: ABC transporter ATP-binding protein [Actinomycetota bacterium]